MNSLSIRGLPKNVWVLALSQALIMSVSSLVVFVGGLIGSILAPTATMATLPVATIVVGTALSVSPMTLLMKKIGRKKTFLFAISFSISVSLFAAWSIHISNFYLFCVSTFLLGVSSACANQFRFAAMESVIADQIPSAASSVLVGGIGAAFLGPQIGLWGKNTLSQPYAGSFLLLAGLFLLGITVIQLGYTEVQLKPLAETTRTRSLKEISGQYIFWVAVTGAAIGYAIMSFIMTATPISMHHVDGHSEAHTKVVIQSHVAAMFIPSLFTGWIIRRISIPKIMIFGLMAYLLCIVIGLWDHSFIHYWSSLLLLGIGWNFLFVGGTALLPLAYRPEERFKVQAFNEFIVFGLQATAALTAGWFLFEFGWKTLLLSTIPFVLVQLIIILKLKNRPL